MGMKNPVVVVSAVVVAIFSVTFLSIEFQKNLVHQGMTQRCADDGRGLASGCQEQPVKGALNKTEKETVESVFEMLKKLDKKTQARVADKVHEALADEIFQRLRGITKKFEDQANGILTAYGISPMIKNTLTRDSIARVLAGLPAGSSVADPMGLTNRLPQGLHSLQNPAGVMFHPNGLATFTFRYRPNITTQATLGTPVLNQSATPLANPFANNPQQNQVLTTVPGTNLQTAIRTPVGAINFAQANPFSVSRAAVLTQQPQLNAQQKFHTSLFDLRNVTKAPQKRPASTPGLAMPAVSVQR